MPTPPNQEMRRAALQQGDPQTSQRWLRKKTSGTTPLDLQARRLRQRYRLGHAIARTIAALAYDGGARP
jgi:hypothetical protein